MRDPKHIVITGASSGLGTALVEAYAAQGITLSLQGRDNIRLANVAEKAKRLGARVTTKTIDVTDAATMASWLQSCDDTQSVDLIIANAGMSAGTDATYSSVYSSHAIFSTNVTGVLNTIHPLLPNMIMRQRGQVAIISSLAGFRGLIGTSAYCASKAAVRLYGESLRGELKHKGIEVNVVCPGFIKTPMTDKNDFPMPFIMSATKAATIIQRGLANNHARIAFPYRLYLLVRLFATIPQDWLDPILIKLPTKKPL